MNVNPHILILTIATALLRTPAIAQDYRYAVFELPGLTTEAQWAGTGGINSSGDVVGFTSIDADYIHAVLWPHEGGVVDLGTLGGDYSAAASINDRGEIAGWAGFRPGGGIYVRHAFLWRNGDMSDLGTLGGETSWANALKNDTQVVGESEYEGGSGARAFLWDSGWMSTLLGARPGTYGRAAFDVNNTGEVVGYGSGLDFQYNGLLWRDGEVFDLGSLAGQGSVAQAINELGQIVGMSETASGAPHAVKWIDQQIIDIHTSSIGLNSFARGVNNLGQIVGDNHNVIHPRAFILNPGEEMKFLDDLVPPRLRIRWRITRATEINDAGQIPVTADLPSNPVDSWALLLSPVSPTMVLAEPNPGRAGEANRLRVTGCTPGARVWFTYGLRGGGTRIPGCDLQQNALQLDSPTVIGTAIADANGVATITRTVPPVAQNQTILFQAVVQNECAISQLVVHRFN